VLRFDAGSPFLEFQRKLVEFLCDLTVRRDVGQIAAPDSSRSEKYYFAHILPACAAVGT
jgi:hypothetical protein